MSEAEDACEKLVKVGKNLKRRRHEFATDLNDDHEEIKKPKLEVKPLPPRRQLSTSKHTPPFLILPREIRDVIYRHVFSSVHPLEWSEDPATVAVPSQPSVGRRSSHSRTLGLLAVNSQIYAEASEILYHHSIFQFLYSWTALAFFRTIGPKKSSMIRHLQLSVGPHNFPVCGYQRQWARTLSSTAFNSIHTLQLHNLHYYHSCLDVLPVPPNILECLADVVIELFGKRQDQTIIPSLTLVGFRDGEEAKFPSSWNIVVKYCLPKASDSRITPSPT